MEEIVGAGVLGEFGHHAANDAKLVGVVGQVWEQVADRQAGLAAGLELPRGGEDLADIVELGGLDLEQFGGVAAVVFVEVGLGVEGINLAGAAIHVEEDDGAGLGRMVQPDQAGGIGQGASSARLGVERGEGDGAEALGAAGEHATPGEGTGHGAATGPGVIHAVHDGLLHALAQVNEFAGVDQRVGQGGQAFGLRCAGGFLAGQEFGQGGFFPG